MPPIYPRKRDAFVPQPGLADEFQDAARGGPEVPFERLSPDVQIEVLLNSGQISREEANRRLDQIPGQERFRFVENPRYAGGQGTRYEKELEWRHSTGKGLLGMAAVGAGGLGANWLTGLSGAGGAATTAAPTVGSPTLAAIPASGGPAAATAGAGIPTSLTAAPGGIAGQIAAGFGAGAPAASAAGSAVGPAVSAALGAGGGWQSYARMAAPIIMSMIGSGEGGDYGYEGNAEQRRFIDPEESLFNALRQIASLSTGLSRQAEMPVANRLPNVGGGSSGRPSLRSAWVGVGGLNTNVPGVPNMTQFFEQLLNPAAGGPQRRVNRMGYQPGSRTPTGEVAVAHGVAQPNRAVRRRSPY